ncbi:TetR/AcrR family transcriptional regulator [Microlunatus parietis]|uniref:AcrR family transcriptional regulator n=1 Tax=Microlunatus parietis TaxID=682979 RepID=A0A7Y9I4M3_9ACTN|nr:TetR/AcrR family transcriptional regulator [Microlunatus parietis]NYE70107.1 AcrR family transcriptional regulator [Microlunatus parietis]
MERPGGRTARVRRAVMVATEDVIVEHGPAGIDLGDVARRAGVGRATVYRRWRTASGLIADLLADMAERSEPRARTGRLETDLLANARLVQRTLNSRRQGPIFRAVIAASTTDPECARALHDFYRTRLRTWAPCVVEAIDRGEAPPGTDPVAVITAVSAPLYYRLLLSDQRLDRRAVEQAVAVTLAGVRAGAFVVEC